MGFRLGQTHFRSFTRVLRGVVISRRDRHKRGDVSVGQLGNVYLRSCRSQSWIRRCTTRDFSPVVRSNRSISTRWTLLVRTKTNDEENFVCQSKKSLKTFFSLLSVIQVLFFVSVT